MKYAISYCRVSSFDQVAGTSLDSQEKACEEYAKKNDFEIMRVFVEKGQSATAANRTELIKALDFCRKNKGVVSAFIVWKIDRFARNASDHFALKVQLAKYKVQLLSVTEPISNDPMGKVIETMLAGFAQFENDIRKIRCENGMQGRIAGGIRPWEPPIGYKNSKKRTETKKLFPDEPDQDKFSLVQKVLKEYKKGKYSITKLAIDATIWGLKSKTGKPMTKQMIDKILQSKFYAGILVNPWTGEDHPGQHEPMITKAEYDEIQRIKNGQSNHATRPRKITNPDFPLRRLVKCDGCGKFLTGGWKKGSRKKYAIYNCFNRDCSHFGHSIPKAKLEDKFLEVLKEIKPQEKFMALFREILADAWQDRHTIAIKQHDHSKNEIKSIEDVKNNLLQMRINNEISKEDYAAEKAKVEKRLNAITVSANSSGTEEVNIEELLSFGLKFVAHIDEEWQTIKDPERKAVLQKTVLKEGIAYNKTANAFSTAVLSPIFALNERFQGDSSLLVAGSRFARESPGYEPDEILLLHPAM